MGGEGAGPALAQRVPAVGRSKRCLVWFGLVGAASVNPRDGGRRGEQQRARSRGRAAEGARDAPVPARQRPGAPGRLPSCARPATAHVRRRRRRRRKRRGCRQASRVRPRRKAGEGGRYRRYARSSVRQEKMTPAHHSLCRATSPLVQSVRESRLFHLIRVCSFGFFPGALRVSVMCVLRRVMAVV